MFRRRELAAPDQSDEWVKRETSSNLAHDADTGFLNEILAIMG